MEGSVSTIPNRVNRVIVLGGGSAGFLAALALKAKLRDLSVLVIRSREIGIIGVGEGSTVGLTKFLHNYLGIIPKKFFEVAQPTWKLGLRFLWGPRPYFNYTFNGEQLNGTVKRLPKIKAWYCHDEMEDEDPFSAMMARDRVFERAPDGGPLIHQSIAYHFENEKFVRFLEGYASALGVNILEDTVADVEQGVDGIAALRLISGRRETADLYVDASGFASVLLGKALGEPFISFESTLFCDRAVVGGWDRTAPEDEVIKPYTTCETMNAGWAWQIEHESRINRGYVYASAFISDAEAEAEFRSKNPKVGPTRIVRFISGRYRNQWVKNVVAVGNAAGFVEPLEATALSAIALQSKSLAEALIDGDREVTGVTRTYYNRLHAIASDAIRNFLSVHYRFNTRLDTPFWRHCRVATELGGAEEVVAIYRENGPSLWLGAVLDREDQFGVPGYLALLLGQQVPRRRPYQPQPGEADAWNAARLQNRKLALRAMTVRDALGAIRSSNWKWQGR